MSVITRHVPFLVNNGWLRSEQKVVQPLRAVEHAIPLLDCPRKPSSQKCGGAIGCYRSNGVIGEVGFSTNFTGKAGGLNGSTQH